MKLGHDIGHLPPAWWQEESESRWPFKRLKYLVRLNPTKREVRGRPDDTEVSFLPMEAVGEYGGLDLTVSRPLADVLDGYTYFRDGDVLVAKITPCFENGKGALATGLINGIGFGTTELHVLRPGEELDANYLFYLIISDHFRRVGTSTMYGAGGQKRVPEDFVEDLVHPLPELRSQQAIADFLDRETAKIDALIDQKQRLIELLQEKRSVVITEAVTKGLDPDVEMKHSGVEWLGSMPALWDQSQLGRLVDAISGGTPDRGERDYWEGDVPWVSPKDMKVREIDDSEEHVTEQALRRTGIKLVQPPAVLIVVRGMILDHTVPVARITRPVTINQDMKALVPRHVAEADYLTWTLEGLAAGLLERVERAAHGTCKLSSSAWKTLTIPIPPEAEQRQICKHLRTITSQIDELIENIRHGAALLKEYRTALISAAVTGKIDVREAAA